jgi:hypothetical protein
MAFFFFFFWWVNDRPFVAGILAVAIGDYGNKSPADLSKDLKANARPVVTGAPNGTTNLLVSQW